MAKVAIVVMVVLADIYAVSTPPMLAISYVAVHCTKGGRLVHVPRSASSCEKSGPQYNTWFLETRESTS